jgi:PAS domain S-box-containing protein
MRDSINHLLQHHISGNEPLSPVARQDIVRITSVYSNFTSVFDSMIYMIYKRGYRDLGLEGEMISYIYQAEKYPVYRKELFEIRKCEREYLNRNDTAYLGILNKLTNTLKIKVLGSSVQEESEKNKFIDLINAYQESVNKLAALDTRLGLRTDSGLRAVLFSNADKLEGDIGQIFAAARLKENQQIARLNILFAVISVFILLSSVGASMYLSRHLVSHLELLTRYISGLSANDFRYSEQLNLRKSSTEIRKIYSEFRNMVAQLRIREIQRDDALADARESEKRNRELADLLPQSIFETDKIGNLVYVNKAWLTAFGYSLQDLEEGLNLIEILQTDRENKLAGIQRVENSDYVAIQKNGDRFPAIVYSDIILKNGEPAGRRGIVIDATLRNQYIEALHKEKVKAIASERHKSSFLANMSHEIRTPMNSIIGFANLLDADQISNDQKKEFIRYIQSSGQILLNLIDDIIDVAKIEAGVLKIRPVECEPAKLITELINTFEGYKTSIGKQDIKLVTVLPEEDIECKTDSFRVKQILTNLMSNAVKFTEQGSVTVSLRKKNERFLEFSVEDTGMGLSHDDLKQIFDRFQRTVRSEEKNISGTGLGLTISKNLVELLGGQMWVSSETDRGTRFWFELPYIRISGMKTKNPDLLKEDRYNWSERTFLIAEDDDKSFIYLRELLDKTGVNLVRAVNGHEVVEAVKFTDAIDCVLMDIQMPYLDGYEATRAIKKINPALPVIAQTAFAMDGDKEKSILAGCDDYITKPVNPAKLLAKINQFLIGNSRLDDLTPEAKVTDHSSINSLQDKKAE